MESHKDYGYEETTQRFGQHLKAKRTGINDVAIRKSTKTSNTAPPVDQLAHRLATQVRNILQLPILSEGIEGSRSTC